ncbi:MAG: hypothetical protein EXR86_15430 [Gammaproteobacteria bacterium]|nr:hypothetical protein [Gammaproteobacteria bacterium]
MELRAPAGYQALVLLDRTKHRERGIRANAASFAAELHVIYLSVIEFVPAARHYPIVFATGENNSLVPCAVLGFEPGQNLMVQNGAWSPDLYCPAYVRRYPFCTVELDHAGPKTAICVDERGLDHTRPYLFDAEGNETPRWRELQRFVEEMEGARRQTEAFTQQLNTLELLEPFEADVNPSIGKRQRLMGMQRVSEDRLKALPDATVKSLLLNGYLARIYAHLTSLDNFHALLQRATRA